MRRGSIIALTVLVPVAALGATLGYAAWAKRASSVRVPVSSAGVWPTPQQVAVGSDGFELTGTVGLVHDASTDPAALDLVTAALEGAGVREVRGTGAAVTIYLGGARPALHDLGVPDSAGLPAEGYVLAARRSGDGGRIVLDGVDSAGQYYAAQTLRQLIRVKDGRASMPTVTVRDWPSMRYRGSIEGFYGTPWSQAERLDHLDYLAAHKMNSYEYSPKDDPFLRDRWREPYPPERLAQFAELIDRARSKHIEFMFALSPGLSICYSSPEDVAAVLAKLDAIYALGARSFDIPLDDIDANAWHCAGDAERYGSGPAAAGTAQAELLDRVRDWATAKGDVHRLQTVPTEYYNTADSPYKRALREHLAPDIVVLWTGVGVIPASITPAQAAAAKAAFGHDILIWDNYPVNDYIPGRLPLAPYSGRQPGLSGAILGVLSNPSNQPSVSKVALFSVADLAWHDATYDPDDAWSAALAELAGGDPTTIAALRVFADLSTLDGKLHLTQAPRLKAAIADFWHRWRAGDRSGALAAIRARANAVAEAPDRIRAGVTDPAFAAQAQAWLQATALRGQGMGAAVDMLAAEAAGDRAAADGAQRRLDQLNAQVDNLRDSRLPHRNVAPFIGDGVVDVFLDDVKAEVANWHTATPGPGPTS